MPETFDEQQVRAWLTNLFEASTGFINIVSTGNWAGQTFATVDEAVNHVKLLEKRQPQGIYARATTLRSIPAKGHRGTEKDTAEFVGFWADLDIATGTHKWHVCDGTPCSGADTKGHSVNHVPLIPDEAACRELITRSGLPEPTEWIHSGGGMYPWWLLDEPLDVTPDTLAAVADASAGWQRVIHLAAQQMGYYYSTVAEDLARVLRIPGTVNRKDPDSPVTAEWLMPESSGTRYDLGELLGAMGAALDRLEPPKPTPQPAPIRPATQAGGKRPGDAFNAATTWDELLSADGATVYKTYNGYTEWTRPGKDKRDGLSATSNYQGGDVLHVFSSDWHPLRANENYDRFGYYMATRHNGDIRAATKQLAALGFGDKLTPTLGASYGDFDAPTHIPAPAATPAAVTGPVVPPPVELEDNSAPLIYGWNDSGIADRLEARHGTEWKHVASRERNGWLHWNGSVWTTDTRGGVINQVDQIYRNAMATAQLDLSRIDPAEHKEIKLQEQLLTKISSAGTNTRQNGAAAIFSRRPRIAAAAEDFDTDPHWVTVGNGSLNLATKEFGPFNRDLLATKKLGTAYDPAAKAPRWEKFLEEVLPDPQMRDYLQRAAGYTLLGDPVRKAMFLLHGVSNTGKSQVIAALRDIFGNFHAGTKEQTFKVNDSATAATPGLQKLRGARLVTASEFNKNTKIDEALIKQMAGGSDMIESRGLYADEESWKPQFAIWIATNHLPQFNADDDAIWKRVKPIHFPVVFGAEGGPAEVMDIGRTLAAEEGPGILNWLLEGVRMYGERGLQEPGALVSGVEKYKQESDPVAQFIEAAIADGAVERAADGKIGTKQLYAWYVAWCVEEGYKFPFASNRFGMRLTKLGYGIGHDSTGTQRIRTGLKATGNQWMSTGHPLRT